MKKALLVSLLLALVFLCACGKTQEEPQSLGLKNPVHETDAEGLFEATGIHLNAPEKAEDLRWSWIDSSEAPPLAQLDFSLDGAQFCLRAKQSQIREDISGLYYDWTEYGEAGAGPWTAEICTDGSAGFACWLDEDAGVLYSLGTSEGADFMLLGLMAEELAALNPG